MTRRFGKELAFVLLLLFFAGSAIAQKGIISDYEKVVEKAKSELDSLMSPAGALQLEAVKMAVKGEFIIDITIHEKGKVLSVFMVSGNTEDVKILNRAKDLVRTAHFSFKMPAGQTYKFQHTFIFK